MNEHERPESDLAIVARVVHEAIRAYQLGLGEKAARPWDEAETWEHEATISGVRFRIDNPSAPVSAQHNQWMAEKLASGWKFGPVKDASKKTHPSLIPYQDLPETERRKDVLFQAVIEALTREV